MQIWAESGKSALPICNYSQILYQFLTFTQNLKRSLFMFLKKHFNFLKCFLLKVLIQLFQKLVGCGATPHGLYPTPLALEQILTISSAAFFIEFTGIYS